MKVRTWQTKDTKNNEYKTAMGSTDFDIPMFGYKSSFFILFAIVTVLFVVPAICEALQVDYRMPSVVFGGIVGGFSVAFSQFFIERKKGFCKAFWIIMSLMSIATGIVIFLLYYTGIIL